MPIDLSQIEDSEIRIMKEKPTAYNIFERQKIMLRNGIHPIGIELSGNGEKCKSCAHIRRKRRDYQKFKCMVAQKINPLAESNIMSDINKEWPACERWQKREKHKDGISEI